MPIAEYFVLPDGMIPSFDEDVIFPFVKKDGKSTTESISRRAQSLNSMTIKSARDFLRDFEVRAKR